MAQGLGEGIGLRLDKSKGCLYVADMSGHLWRCSVKGGLKQKIYEGPTHAYTGVTFYRLRELEVGDIQESNGTLICTLFFQHIITREDSNQSSILLSCRTEASRNAASDRIASLLTTGNSRHAQTSDLVSCILLLKLDSDRLHVRNHDCL